MKRSLKRILALCIGSALALSVVGCGKGGDDNPGGGQKIYDNETTPVRFAISALDGNFNPFFYTAASDGEVVGMTQISMLSADSNGNPVCGENEPTVALDYTITYKDPDGQVINAGTMDGTSEYEFLIKNGIKFSDGQPLTIDDVLFNMYVYLDPNYTGSSTMYSTDIQGLTAYRYQDPLLADDDVMGDDMFYAAATQRINNIIAHVEDDEPSTPEIEEDILTVRRLFREEVESDWTTNAGSLESFVEEGYNFQYDWQSYYLNEGIINVKTDWYTNDAGELVYGKLKDENGKYITDLDDPLNTLTQEMNDSIADKLGEYMDKNGGDEELAREQIMRDTAIETVYYNYMGTDEVPVKSSLLDILRYWATASNALEEFAAEERSDYYNSMTSDDGSLVVEDISGITTYRTSTFNGQELGEEHDVLKIVINGIDPKAIWNFAFTVAPMHYYSNADAINNVTGRSPHGVVFSDKTFFDTVLKDGDKNGLPVGAGVYMATTATGDYQNVNKNTFYENNVVYYERNPYFETTGAGINNAKIKYFRYQVVGEDKIKNALISGQIDYGMPQATQKNINDIGAESETLAYATWKTGGYGYVGINPKYVPDLEVRQAIMKAMDPSMIITNYYTPALAEPIYRPMTTTSWAYPTGCQPYYEMATTQKEITDLVEAAGWRKGADGVYQKNGQRLAFKFTIAGETTDHPAYAMFESAAQFLNSCGFEITVGTDIQALKKLATGNLAVWAAAWSSAIDPDMYQVYHKDSTATSVNNWNYKNILNDSTGQFEREKQTIELLSDAIERARETNNRDERKARYSEALDLVMELAVEFPAYQRMDLAVYNKTKIDGSTLNQSPSYMEGLVSRIWEMDLL